ncbi:hypothetical protein EIP86_004563 [Pleurotus ostreatoroseus]|nr:hypothetical protein EIP86_004563 [Pleurotus ostreatoroseus]
MATIRPRFDVHNCPLKLYCVLNLTVCIPLSLASMLAGNVSGGRICIPSLCLKYLVICIANALLATGWLLIVRPPRLLQKIERQLMHCLQSVLSILAAILPSILNVPPTLPKLSPREASPKTDNKERPAVASVSMTTGVEVSYESASGGQIFTSRAVFESTQTVKRNETRSHRVRFAGSDKSGPVASTSRAGTPPQTPERRATVLPVESLVSSPESLPNTPLPSPPLPADAVVRGRKHGFLRRGVSEKQSRGVPTPGTSLPTPPHSAATSPARSPERRDSVGLQRSSTAPHPSKSSFPTLSNILLKSFLFIVRPCRRRSGDSAPAKRGPVARTDPYQAPYFFPTPLSPEAVDYVDKVRSERVGFSPEQRPKPSLPSVRRTRSPSPHARPSPPPQPPVQQEMLPTPAASPQRGAHLDLAPDSPELASTSGPEVAPSSASTGSRSGSMKRRSWHISLHHHHHRDNSASGHSLERPTSWASDATTAGSSSGDSSGHAAVRPKLSGFWRYVKAVTRPGRGM